MRPARSGVQYAGCNLSVGALASHLRGLAPLPREELAALKRSIAELSAIGRNLNQLAKALAKTRNDVVASWQQIAQQLHETGQRALAGDVWRFINDMPLPQTERQWIARRLWQDLPQSPRLQDRQLSR